MKNILALAFFFLLSFKAFAQITYSFSIPTVEKNTSFTIDFNFTTNQSYAEVKFYKKVNNAFQLVNHFPKDMSGYTLQSGDSTGLLEYKIEGCYYDTANNYNFVCGIDTVYPSIMVVDGSPTNLDITWGDLGLNLDWTSNKAAVVEIQKGSGQWNEIAKRSQYHSFFDYNTAEVGLYRFRVKACDADYESNCSGWATSNQISFNPDVPDDFKNYDSTHSSIDNELVEFTPGSYSVSQGNFSYNIPIDVPAFPSGLKANISHANVRLGYPYIRGFNDKITELKYCARSNAVKSIDEQLDESATAGEVDSTSTGLTDRLCYNDKVLIKVGGMVANESNKAVYEAEYWQTGAEYYVENAPSIRFVASGSYTNTVRDYNIHREITLLLPNGHTKLYKPYVSLSGDATANFKLHRHSDTYGNWIDYLYTHALNYQINYSNGYKITLSGFAFDDSNMLATPDDQLWLTVFSGNQPIKQYRFMFESQSGVQGHYLADFDMISSAKVCGFNENTTDWQDAKCAKPINFEWNSTKLIKSVTGSRKPIYVTYDSSKYRPVIGLYRYEDWTVKEYGYTQRYKDNLQRSTPINDTYTTSGAFKEFRYGDAVYKRNNGVILEEDRFVPVLTENGKPNDFLGYTYIHTKNLEAKQYSENEYSYTETDTSPQLDYTERGVIDGYSNKTATHETTYHYQQHGSGDFKYLEHAKTLTYQANLAGSSVTRQLLGNVVVQYEFDSYKNLTKQTTSHYTSSNNTSLLKREVINSSVTNNPQAWLLGFVNTLTETNTVYAGQGAGTKYVKTKFTPQSGSTDIRTSTLYNGNNNTPVRVVTTVRDSMGRVTSESVAANNAQSQWETRTTSFTSFNGVGSPQTVSDANNTPTTLTYDTRFQVPKTTNDIDDISHSTVYNPLGRAIQSIDNNGVTQSTVRFYCSQALVSCPTGTYTEGDMEFSVYASYGETQTLTHTNTHQQGLTKVINYYNGVHQLVGQDKHLLGGDVLRQLFLYYENGKTWRESLPFEVNHPPSSNGGTWKTYIYDDLMRLSKILHNDNDLMVTSGGETNFSYSTVSESGAYVNKVTETKTVNTLHVSSPSSIPEFFPGETVSKSSYYNMLGQLIKVVDAQGTAITYEYDGHGNLVKTRVNGNSHTDVKIEYNHLGERVYMADPSAGRLNFEYSGFGELKKQIWSKNNAHQKMMQFEYDELGRQTKRLDSMPGQATKTHLWSYDAQYYGMLDKIITASNGNGSGSGEFIEQYRYNTQGQLDKYTASVPQDNWSKSFYYNYDELGRQAKVTYPTWHEVAYDYHDEGFLLRAKEVNTQNGASWWSNGPSRIWQAGKQTVDSQHNMSHGMLFGNQVVATTHTSGNGYYIQKTAGKYQNGNLNSELQSARYLFNTSGALKTREETQSDLSGGFDLKERFTYDPLNRVKSSHVYRKNAGASEQLINSANYDYDDLGNLDYRSDKGGTFYYNRTNGASVHGVTSANGLTYKYDEYGNVIQKGSSHISYNIFNKPSNIDGQQFYYGADHKRYRKVDADGTKTYYLMGGMYEEIVEGATVTYNSYVDGVYLLQETVSYGYMGNTKRRYLLQDHLGSTSVITNESGLIEERLSFNTWGERRASNWSSNSVSLNGLTSTRGFTGHEMLDDSGLIHMNGRVYDPSAGRFLSADILIQAPTNTQSYNRYSYVLNNPLSYVDPTGYQGEGGCTYNGAPMDCSWVYQHSEDLGGSTYTEAFNEQHLAGLYSAREDNISYSQLLKNRYNFSQGLVNGSVDIIDNPDGQKAHSLSFDGKALRWIDGEGNVVDEWGAISGRPSRGGGRSKTKDYTGAGSQSLEDKGPIPEGTWAVRVERFQARNQSGWQEFKGALGGSAWPGGHDSWGDYRVWLEPLGNTNTYGRSGFSIHGGVIPGSAGCIDLCGMMPSFAQRFQSYGQDMVLTVKY
ncbi:RHS repeat domain-containing protein [Paraglaciecola sp. L3A3]|uniref:RHS repeat domain-containing protein n=1 Tax=Paraglaciecola sp. L3A3 TaxID=2686358 RepID=UPI00131CDA55|nr:RHS repeat-associated core domain-containing protein [Paraglaciecola sp. L3A3]